MGSFIEKIDGDWTLQTLNANDVVTINSSTISLIGNVRTPNTISATGNITTAGYFLGNLIGNITGNIAITGANTEVLFNNSGVVGAASGFTFDYVTNTLSVGNVVTVAGNIIPGNVYTVGNVTANYFLGNGAFLTGLAAPYGNADVAAFLPTYTGNLVSLQGPVITLANVTAGNILTGGLISSSGNITSAANVTGGNLFTSGAVSAAGNIDGGNLLTTGLISVAGNIDGSNIIASNLLQATTVSATGNVIANNISFTSSLTGATISASGNINGSNVNAIRVSAVANVTGGNINTAGVISAAGGANIGNDTFIDGNLTVTGNAVLYGNILGDRIVNGNTTVEIQTPNGNANVSIGGVSNVAVFTTSGLSINGNIITTGNSTASYFIGNGSQLTGVIASSVDANTLTGAQLANNVIYSNLTTLGTLVSASVSGNINAGNIKTTGLISATGNITGNYLLGNIAYATGYNSNSIYNGTSNISIATPNGNVTVSVDGTGNIAVFSSSGLNITGNLSVTGNIIGNTFVGNGAGLTSVVADRGNDPNNWNTLTQMGVYTVNRSDWSGTVGTPLDSQIYVGLLEVKNSTNTSLEQSFYPGAVVTGNVKTQWNRVYWGGSWSAWYYVVNDDQVLIGGDF